MPGLLAEFYRLSLCHMVQKLQAFMSVANFGTYTLAASAYEVYQNAYFHHKFSYQQIDATLISESNRNKSVHELSYSISRQ